MAIEAYPLAWPRGWKREKFPQISQFKKTFYQVFKDLEYELDRAGASKIIVSSNNRVGVSGRMRMDREPIDTGVAVYFTRNNQSMVFACDRFNKVKDNVQAIAMTLEALRGIERWGASDMMERTFTGFKALASENPGESWWKVLQIDADASEEQIQTAYRRMAKLAHQDAGGSDVAMTALNVARDQALAVARQRG